jgi:hypothetical protein
MADKDIDRLSEINRELAKRTNRTKEYIALEKEALSLKKNQAKLEKTMEGIRSSEEGIQRRINSALKDREGSISSILKSAIKMDLSSAAELLNKRKIAGESKKLAEGQQSIADSLQKDVKAGKISITDRKKILSIQDGIASGKIKENDIGGKLQGLSAKGLKNSKLYGEGLKGQAISQGKIGNLISKSSGGLAGMASKLGAFGTIAAAVFKVVSQFAGKIDAVGKTFGFLTSKNEQFRNGLIDAGNEAILIGKGLEDVLSVTTQLSSEFGITLAEAGDLSNKILDTAVATGISNDEATKLFGTFMQIGGLTSKQAENLIESTAQLAAQKGVAPQAVLKDMAGSAEEIAGFTKDGGKNIAEAAVQARQMGLSLSTTAKIADGLLDFESSIANEMEASIMIGKQLNFQKARQLALDGDIAGATKNIVDQVGSEADFNALNVLQRRSLAKSIGVSVTEMAKLVKGSEKLTLSGALAGKSFGDLIGQDSLSTLTSIVNGIKAIGATILDTLGRPINNLLEKLRSTITGEEGIAKVRKFFSSFGNILIGLVNTIGVVGSFFSDTKFTKIKMQDFGFGESVNDFKSGPGQITHMMGPAGMFSLNPRDSVMGTTNRVNDFQQFPAGALPGNGMDAEAFGKAVAANINLSSTLDHGRHKVQLNSTLSPYGGHSMNPGK